MRVPILCYHKVGPILEEGRFLNVSPELLERHVLFFQKRGYKFVNAADIAFDAKAVCLTFDDAYLSAMSFGLEVLRRRQVAASFFVVPALVGRTSQWDEDRARPLADWPLILTAAKEGFEIGNHSQTHPHLSQLEPAQQRSQLQSAHEELLARGIEAKTVCYPYGDYSPSTLSEVERLGYAYGLALGKSRANRKSNRLALPRIVVACSDGLPKLLYKIWIRPILP